MAGDHAPVLVVLALAPTMIASSIIAESGPAFNLAFALVEVYL